MAPVALYLDARIKRVPAVTEENMSVPGSLSTGADSPVGRQHVEGIGLPVHRLAYGVSADQPIYRPSTGSKTGSKGVFRSMTIAHDAVEYPGLPEVADHVAEADHECSGEQRHQGHQQPIGQRRRILEGMCRVGIEKTAAIGTQMFDCRRDSGRPGC